MKIENRTNRYFNSIYKYTNINITMILSINSQIIIFLTQAFTSQHTTKPVSPMASSMVYNYPTTYINNYIKYFIHSFIYTISQLMNNMKKIYIEYKV